MSVEIYTLTSSCNDQSNSMSIESSPLKNDCDIEVDLDSLRLKLFAEFDTWDDFVDAVDEFQKKTCIKLTIITSKKLKANEKRRTRSHNSENQFEGEEEMEGGGAGEEGDGGVGEENVEEAQIQPPAQQSQQSTTARKSRRQANKLNGQKEDQRVKGGGDKTRFEYQYLKLTCKHYGRYTSTSKGIRPNQKTAKLECPTFLYASYDHYKDKFVIKQMLINCNHELKDEDVSLPRLLQRAGNNGGTRPSTPPIEVPTGDGSRMRKKYVKVHNRNILKVPLDSPTPGALILSVQKRIKCNHDINSICQAASLTNEDLLSIHSTFSDKSKQEQNKLIIQWVTLNNYNPNVSHLTPNKIQKHIRSSENENTPSTDTIVIQFKLPTFDGSLINVCFKAFMSILNISNSRVNEVICEYHAKNGPKRGSKHNQQHHQHQHQQQFDDFDPVNQQSREIENSVATILTSFNNSGNAVTVHPADLIEVVETDSQQVMIIDTVDVPTTENTIEDVFDQEGHKQMMEEVVTTSTIVPVVISETRFELNSMPWWRQVVEEHSENDFYCKVDPKRRISLLNVTFNDQNFAIEVYGQPLNLAEHTHLEQLHNQYVESKNKVHVLEQIDQLTICSGISDPHLKQLATQLKNSNVNQVFIYCSFSDAVHSPRCRLVYGSEWNFAICRDCYSILDNSTTVHT